MQPAIIEHALPGRVRLRFPAERGNVPFFEQLVALVSQYPAVREVRANPRTGSLLVRHSGSLDEIGRAAVQLGLVSDTALAQLKAGVAGKSVWKALLTQPRNLSLLLLTGIGAVRVLRGQVAGPASEQFWHAYQMWHRQMPQAAAILALLGMLQISRGKMLGPATSLLVYGLMMQNARSARPLR